MLAAVTLVLVSSLALAAPDPTGGVYVRDSGIAVEKFALADRMERLGEWGKAADIYQEMLQQQADRVVASAADATRFRSVIAAVQDRLSHWSPDGLAIYRERFGPEAQSLLEQSEAEHRDDNTDDAAGLHKVFSRYFVTDAGKTAGLRLMDLRWRTRIFPRPNGSDSVCSINIRCCSTTGCAFCTARRWQNISAAIRPPPAHD